VDPTGREIGKVSGVYVDEETNEPRWLAITTGWFGTRVSLAPVAGAYLAEDDVVVAYPKDTVKDAPNIDADGSLTSDEALALYASYGISTTHQRESGRVRLRKWVETDDIHMTVPIQRETSRHVTQPITPVEGTEENI